jgi:hypothetical protein
MLITLKPPHLLILADKGRFMLRLEDTFSQRLISMPELCDQPMLLELPQAIS